MGRTIIGPGTHGAIARLVQNALVTAGWLNPADVDGWYGRGTASAVTAHQRSHSLPATGAVDTDTWGTLLPGTPSPTLSQRCLDLTGAFEGHDYTLAVGNFDGAWLTWGVVGFTLKYGAVAKILLEAQRTCPDTLQLAFADHTQEVLDIIRAKRKEQEQWADSITVRSGLLAEPWRTAFRTLGKLVDIQKIQQRVAEADYFQPALETATKFGLTSELGMALCFDIHVQNGGINKRAQSLLGESRPGNELTLRTAIAEAVAKCARPEYREMYARASSRSRTGGGVSTEPSSSWRTGACRICRRGSRSKLPRAAAANKKRGISAALSQIRTLKVERQTSAERTR
jgi:peptidoglycan hydrolase-like protein with peptidoglycan-binding domain